MNSLLDVADAVDEDPARGTRVDLALAVDARNALSAGDGGTVDRSGGIGAAAARLEGGLDVEALKALGGGDGAEVRANRAVGDLVTADLGGGRTGLADADGGVDAVVAALDETLVALPATVARGRAEVGRRVRAVGVHPARVIVAVLADDEVAVLVDDAVDALLVRVPSACPALDLRASGVDVGVRLSGHDGIGDVLDKLGLERTVLKAPAGVAVLGSVRPKKDGLEAS